MSDELKKKNDNPSSNYQEEIPRGKVPAGDKVVKKPEDKDYQAEEGVFDDMVSRKETDEQPVNPVKTPPKKD